MNNSKSLFQEKLEQLEAGMPVEACLEGLPEQEAGALRFAAALRQVPIPDEHEAAVAAQRTAVLQAAARNLNGRSTIVPFPQQSMIDQLRRRLDWLFSRRELAAGMAFLLVLAVGALAWFGFSQRAGLTTPIPLAVTEPEADVEEVVAEPGSPREAIELSEAPETGEEIAVVDMPESEPGHTIFMPAVAHPLNLNPKMAVVQDVKGIVEVQAADGSWTAVNQTTTIAAGQRIRSGALSSAAIAFFDGSQAQLGPNSELSIDELDAQLPADGFRTVVMTQWAGESDHSVQFRNDRGSLYEVKTAAGSGIARGTKFHVLVTPGLLARYTVTEGKVDVTGLSRTVPVAAGQLTTIIAGRAPAPPSFSVVGEGEVSQIGPVWIVAGQEFQTDENSIIIGNPQVGDLVLVEGRLLPEGGQIADRIILLRRAIADQFTLTGEVETIGSAAWTVAGQTILITTDTVIGEDIIVGDKVRVDGVILDGGDLQAERIERLEDTPGFPFHFAGVVETIETDTWSVSGQTISLDGETDVAAGIVVGDLVAVSGWILDDGTWLAQSIVRLNDSEREFAFTGEVQSIDPWIVAGIPFETREWTIIEPGIEVGDRVRVRGVVEADGVWVASEIASLEEDDDDAQVITLIGFVDSTDPWMVNGIQLFVDDNTLIVGDISVGTLVRVDVQLMPDGTWRVLQIMPLFPTFGWGCLILSSQVIGLTPNGIRLKHWDEEIERDGDFDIDDDVTLGSIVILPICTLHDGTIIIFGDIIIIYQPILILPPAPPAPPAPPPGNDNGRPPQNGNNNHNGK